MLKNTEFYENSKKRLVAAAKKQDAYELSTINLIAPASPTPYKYTDTSRYLQANPIAEGLLGNRPYAGVEGFNEIEKIAASLAVALFNADHANVQPHSVSQANQSAYQALLRGNDKVLAMEFKSGGHLTHGMKKNFSGQMYDFNFYGVDSNGLIDYESLEEQALVSKPKAIICGASSYPRQINFKKIKDICDQVGASLIADLSHPAGLIVAGRFPQPFPYCDIVTFTPDKTMLGPHGGIILCKENLSNQVDKAVHPGVQSSIPLHRILSTALCLADAGKPWFVDFIDRIITNIKVFEREFNKYSGLMVTGGTDTHLMVLNTLNVFGLTGKEAEQLLEEVGILTNRQLIPEDTQSPYIASGLRLGTTWITGRGYTETDVQQIAEIIIDLFQEPNDIQLRKKIKQEVSTIISQSRELDVWKKHD